MITVVDVVIVYLDGRNDAFECADIGFETRTVRAFIEGTVAIIPFESIKFITYPVVPGMDFCDWK